MNRKFLIFAVFVLILLTTMEAHETFDTQFETNRKYKSMRYVKFYVPFLFSNE